MVCLLSGQNHFEIQSNNYISRRILREVKQSGEIYIVLDCDVENVITVLREAQAVGMMTAYHNYLITNLDLHLVDMEEFKYGGTNITALRLVDPYRDNVQVNSNNKLQTVHSLI